MARRIVTTLRPGAGAQQALDHIALAEERARYAKAAQAPDSLRADVVIVRRALAAEASRTARWRARLLPVSALAPVRAGCGTRLTCSAGWTGRECGCGARRPAGGVRGRLTAPTASAGRACYPGETQGEMRGRLG